MDDPILLTVEDASRVLGFGRSRTYALVASGVLPSLRIGRSIRISRQQLERWVDGLPEATPSQAPEGGNMGLSPDHTHARRGSAGE